jgi:hypothetical protein
VDAGAQTSITVTLSSAASTPVTFTYSTSSGTAVSGTDFTGITKTVTIPAGTTSVVLPVSTSSGGAGKTFTVSLSSITNATAGNVSSTVSIVSVPACTGTFTPQLSQLGGGFQTTGSAVIRDSTTTCHTWVAGTNQISSTGGGTIPLATEAGSASPSDATSVILSQFDYQGELMWTTEYGFSNAVAHVAGLVQDASGNFYVGGYVSCVSGQTCSFGSTHVGALADGLGSTNGNSNAFILKFNSSGTLLSAWQLNGGTGASGPTITATGLAIDGNGTQHLYLTGGTANTLGPTSIDGNVGQIDGYVAAFALAGGAPTWITEMGDEGCGTGGTNFPCAQSIAQYLPTAIAVDQANQFVDVAGQASGALTGNQYYFGNSGGQGYIINWFHGAVDLFAARMALASGAVTGGGGKWVTQLTTGSSVWASGLQLDASGNLFISGYTEGIMGGTTGYGSSDVFTQYGQHGVKDLFMVEFDTVPNLVAVTEYGKQGASITAPAQGMTLTRSGSNFYLLGQTDTYLGGGCYFGCGVNTDTILVQLGSAGQFNGWFTEIGPVVSGSSNRFGLATDSSGNSYLTSLVSSAIGLLEGTHGDDMLFGTVSPTGAMSAPSSTAPSVTANPWPVQQSAAAATTKGQGVVQDASGNIYAVGYTSASLAGATVYGTHGAYDALVTKVDHTGVLLWTRQLATNVGTDTTQGTGIALDSGGNVWITGQTSGSGTIHGATQLGARGTVDLFVAELTPSGAQGVTIQYGQSGSGGATFAMGGIALDGANNIYVAGTINQRFTGSNLQGSVGLSDLFVAKYNGAGAFQFASELGHIAVDTQGMALALDGAGNIDVVGNSDGEIATQVGNAGSQDLLVAQFSSVGAFNWASELGSGSGNITLGYAIALDKNGNIVVTGSASDQGGNGSSLSAYPAGSQGGAQQYGSTIVAGTGGGGQFCAPTNLVLASFAPSTGALNWANQLGASAPCQGGEACSGLLAAQTTGTGLWVDSSNNIFVAGYTSGIVPGETQYLAHGNGGNGNSIIGNDALVSQFHADGTYQWTSQLGFTATDTQAWGIAHNASWSGSPALVGFTAAFLGGTQEGAQGAYDLFVMHVSPNGVLP